MKKLITVKAVSFLRATLLTSLLLVFSLNLNAQNVWTRRTVDPPEHFYDVAYGAGKYVGVGGAGLIRISQDGSAWQTQPAGVNQYYSLNSIIYANGKFVLVGTGGTIMTSPDGLSWTQRNSGSDKTLQGIVYGGGVYVAVGAYGTLLTSPDGENWTSQSSGTASDLYDVAYGNNTFVTVGDNGEIRTSAYDGVNWTKRNSGTTRRLRAVTAGKYTNFAAVGNFGTIVYSGNSVDWAVKPGPAAAANMSLIGVACNPTTGSFVAVCTGDQVIRSFDGAFWGSAPVPSGANFILFRIRFLQNHFLATGRYMIVRASYNDGKTWNSPAPNFWGMNMNGAAYGKGRFVAVGNEPLDNGTTGLGMSNLIINSTDGINFKASETLHLVGGAKSFNDVVFGNGMFVAVGTDAIIQTSLDGVKWSYSQVNFGKTLTGVAYGNGRFVAVGNDGLILWSLDGKAWYKANSVGTVSYNGIHFANGQFVLVGRGGALATSPQGANWDFKATYTQNNLTSVVFGGGRWTAVGSFNTIVTSTNGISWKSQQFNPTDVHFTDVCYANGQFIAVTTSGKFYSCVNANLFTKNPYYFTYDNLNSITHGNGQFFAVGNSGILMTSPFADGPILATPPQPNTPPICKTCRTSEEGEISTESEGEAEFSVTTYPNPVEDQFSVEVKGARDEKVRLQLVDVSGRTVLDKVVNATNGGYQESIPMAQKQTGLYLLRVSTATKTQTSKILKN